MYRKIVLVLLSILVIFNSTTFLSFSQKSQTEPSADRPPTLNVPIDLWDLWKDWIDQRTEIIVGDVLEEWEKRGLITEIDDTIFTDVYTSVRKQLTAQAIEIEKQLPSPHDMKEYEIEVTIENTGTRKHFGPQTVEAIMESFHEEYSNATKYLYGETHLKELDAKYLPDEWIQMFLDKEVPIENADDYWTYIISLRGSLVNIENKPEEWASGKHGISPTDDFDTYKVAFVNRMIWEHQQRQAAILADPNLMGGFFGGPEVRTFFPYKKGRIYVKSAGKKFVFSGAKLTPKQQFELLSEGIIPEGHQIIYLDENSNRRSEPLPPISREVLLEAGIPGPPWNTAVPKDNEPEVPSTRAPTGELFRVHVQHPDRLITPISPRYTTKHHYRVKTQVQKNPRQVHDAPPQDDR